MLRGWVTGIVKDHTVPEQSGVFEKVRAFFHTFFSQDYIFKAFGL